MPITITLPDHVTAWDLQQMLRGWNVVISIGSGVTVDGRLPQFPEEEFSDTEGDDLFWLDNVRGDEGVWAAFKLEEIKEIAIS